MVQEPWLDGFQSHARRSSPMIFLLFRWVVVTVAERGDRTLLTIDIRTLRLASGLILSAFLLMHLLNLSFGLISPAAMETMRPWLSAPWRSIPGTILLYGAVLCHFTLALIALYGRQTLRMPLRETLQQVFGFLIPLLMIPHVMGTRLLYALTSYEMTYFNVINTLWVEAPLMGLRQSVAIFVVWSHCCLGLYFWLRSKRSFRKYSTAFFTMVVLIPIIGWLGFMEAGKAIAASGVAGMQRPPPAGPMGETISTVLYGVYFAALGGTLAARGIRSLRGRYFRRIRIGYPGGRVSVVRAGFSVLEASRARGIPHPSVCGGRGRCSTCRVRILRGMEDQPPPTGRELTTLERIEAGPDVRLACQFRPTHDIEVAPILLVDELDKALPVRKSSAVSNVKEQEVVVLFCDLRGFTSFVERRLPFDTVFVLNRYFEIVGAAVEQAGGRMDKFVGDGAIALFGLNASPAAGALQAITAGLAISRGLKALNEAYADELGEPLRFVLSLHAGPAIVGNMGYGGAMQFTAVGDTINVASRLEELAKRLDAEMVVSNDLISKTPLDLSAFERKNLTVRGRTEPLEVWVVPRAADLEVKVELA
ncbi:adenylate/guanylate cyclase domain-containing protein [Metarhizobium album]|uniref:adenylate/guanylate cyclase domain-containing protein n=1 Tax=Metarhizobium album TaxID=2182425 RepID=UPI001FDF0F09|nr:adenylate/guanylate cyclase domain-containing protein [Rhizobium album]